VVSTTTTKRAMLRMLRTSRTAKRVGVDKDIGVA
jgi:hypothetical protein